MLESEIFSHKQMNIDYWEDGAGAAVKDDAAIVFEYKLFINKCKQY